MASSKVWRKGRWFWSCVENNNASDWKDSWACGARSKLTYTTEKEADRAGAYHGGRTCHEIRVTQIRPLNTLRKVSAKELANRKNKAL